MVACWHCHSPFAHADPTGWTGTAGGARPGATTAQDPAHIMSTLDDILKS
jgi:hypothetical protein